MWPRARISKPLDGTEATPRASVTDGVGAGQSGCGVCDLRQFRPGRNKMSAFWDTPSHPLLWHILRFFSPFVVCYVITTYILLYNLLFGNSYLCGVVKPIISVSSSTSKSLNFNSTIAIKNYPHNRSDLQL